MFDGLRKDASDSSAFDEQAEFFSEDKPDIPVRRRKPGAFLGLTPIQRFILAVMLMMTVCVLGMMCMVITGKFMF